MQVLDKYLPFLPRKECANLYIREFLIHVGFFAQRGPELASLNSVGVILMNDNSASGS